MPAPAIVLIILVVVIVLVLAGFLLTIAKVLLDVNKRLGAVIGAVGTIASRTEPVNPAVQSINSNLGTARDVLTSLLVSKVGANGAAQLVASVDPLAEAPADEDTNIRYVRAGYDPASAEPEPAAESESEPEPEPEARERGADEPIRYSRAGYDPASAVER